MNIAKLWQCCFVLSLLCALAHAQATKLEPNENLERAIAGGESHTYQLTLQAGQFALVRLRQPTLDSVVVLAAPDGSKLVERNLIYAGESLAWEAAASGNYQFTVRANGTAPQRGTYRLELTVRAIVSAPDRQRLAAEALLAEAAKLRAQRGQMAQQVLEKAQEAMLRWRELNEPTWIIAALNLMAGAHIDLGQFQLAANTYEQVLALYREQRNRVGESRTLGSLGIAYRNLDRYEKAIEFYEQTLVISRELQDQGGLARTFYNMGNVWRSLSRYEKSLECHEQALLLFRALKERAFEGLALNAISLAWRNLSRYEKQIESCEQALAIFREVKNRPYEAIALNSLGLAYYDLGRYEKAIEYNEQALAIFRELKSRSEEGGILANLGGAYRELGRFEKALEFFEQSLAIARALQERANEGMTLSNLGGVQLSLGRAEQALENLKQALTIAREVKNRSDEANVLQNLGAAYQRMGRNEQAATYYEQSLAIRREIHQRYGEVLSLASLAQVERAQGQLLAARTHVEESLKLSESLRAEVTSAESRTSLQATVQSAYQLYTELLMQQHRTAPTQGFDALALANSERQRARSLLDLLSESRTDLRQGADATLLERERSLARQLNAKAQQLSQATQAEQLTALKQEVSRLETELERAQVALRRANPHYAAVTQPQPLTLKEIQQQLDADTLLLEYALGAERSYVWMIAPDSLTSYELPKAETIEKSARQVYALLQARSTLKRRETIAQQRERWAQADQQLAVAAQELSHHLLAPVAAHIGQKRLVIVADGALQYVPFALLPDPAVRNQAAQGRQRAVSFPPPLIVRHEIVSLPSASALAVQRNELAGRPPAPKLLAVIADPVFDRSDPRLSGVPAQSEAEITTRSLDEQRSVEHLAEKSAGPAHATARKLVIPRLPFTRREAQQLLALAPREAVSSALDFQANRATVLNPGLGQYRYVHFATHGVLDSERPGLSSLLLSLVDEQGKPQDGFLRANDIYNLKLPAELVVLSACQSGLGKEIKGEGLIGLTRGFMYAGAARVVVSLWNVNDQATAELMTRFYRKMLKQGERPAAALRAAQVELWKQQQWSAPFYWAAFSLQGEWK